MPAPKTEMIRTEATLSWPGPNGPVEVVLTAVGATNQGMRRPDNQDSMWLSGRVVPFPTEPALQPRTPQGPLIPWDRITAFAREKTTKLKAALSGPRQLENNAVPVQAEDFFTPGKTVRVICSDGSFDNGWTVMESTSTAVAVSRDRGRGPESHLLPRQQMEIANRLGADLWRNRQIIIRRPQEQGGFIFQAGWQVVGFDPKTNTYTAVRGQETATGITIRQLEAWNIDSLGQVRLEARKNDLAAERSSMVPTEGCFNNPGITNLNQVEQLIDRLGYVFGSEDAFSAKDVKALIQQCVWGTIPIDAIPRTDGLRSAVRRILKSSGYSFVKKKSHWYAQRAA